MRISKQLIKENRDYIFIIIVSKFEIVRFIYCLWFKVNYLLFEVPWAQ